MKRFKLRIVILIFGIIVCSGILKINVEYNKNIKKQGETINYKDNLISAKKADLYSEINISRKNSKKLKIYYTREPFDLTIDFGNYVMYINRQVYFNMVEEKNRIINNARYIINNNLINRIFKGKTQVKSSY